MSEVASGPFRGQEPAGGNFSLCPWGSFDTSSPNMYDVSLLDGRFGVQPAKEGSADLWLGRKIVLTGSKAFYRERAYKKRAQEDFEQEAPLYPSSSYEPESEGLGSQFLSRVDQIVRGPLQSFLGSSLFATSDSDKIATRARAHIDLETEWVFRRVSVLVDGFKVDGMLMGRPSTLANGRWVLNTLGRSGFYECHVIKNPGEMNPDHADYLTSMHQMLSRLEANVVYYNPPGMAASEGKTTRSSVDRAHEAFLQFLEYNIGAREIVDYGHSIAGVAQGDSWAAHIPRAGVKYVLVKDRTFKTMSGMISATMGRSLGYLSWLAGWDMDSMQSSKTLPFPEVHILSLKGLRSPQRLTRSSQVEYGDARIPVGESLGMEFLRSDAPSQGPKLFVGVPERHEDPIQDPSVIADAIIEGLSQ